ncbi:MAG: phosphoglycerate mutase family protein [Nitriliruptoraceae bacterium]
MTLLLVRHADAGDRAAWTGDDRQRPLSATGRRQSEALAALHADRDIDAVLSSPARRCVQTVEPIADALGLPVEEQESLAEGAPFEDVDRLLTEHADRNVLLCSHGDVMDAILTALRRRGHLPDRPTARKAASWIVEGWPDPSRTEVLDPPNVG